MFGRATIRLGIGPHSSVNLGCRSETCCMWLAENTGWKTMQKIAIWAPSHNFVGLYLRNYGTYQQSEKLVKQQYLLYMSSQHGKLRPTSGWDRFVSLGHPSKFQRLLRLGSVTAWHSSSGHHQTAALNRRRHLYSALDRAAITLGIGPHSGFSSFFCNFQNSGICTKHL